MDDRRNPSSLLFHFNIDIHGMVFYSIAFHALIICLDIHFITTENEELPTPSTSTDITAGDNLGRGSLVWFNQGNMFYGAELGYDSLGDAQKAGVTHITDFADDAQKAFTTLVQKIPL